jgi:phosphoglycolate phosphatase (TIGR01487 family)
MNRRESPPTGRPLRALATDLDGTVTDGRRELFAPTIEALRRLNRRGVPIVLATGNVLPIALAYHRLLGLRGPIVAENGGLIYETRGDRIRITRLADRAIALRALGRLRRAGLRPKPLLTDRWRETEVALEPQLPVERARRVLRGTGVDVVPTGFAVHLIETGMGKLPALERVLAPYGLAPADCLIAGDGENDVTMLAAAGWAVSFRGADPKARAVADYVARAKNAAGLLEALKRATVVPPAPLR